MGYLAGLLLAVLLGAFVRLAPAVEAGFPLNDGGLFYAMVQDLRSSHYALPFHCSYNSAGIPFAYPPLALYLAALLTDLGGWPLAEFFRFFPALVSILAIPAFYLLGNAVLGSKRRALFATFAFAVLPLAFTQRIMGGGVTRGLGYLFALLTLQQVYLLYSRRQTRFLWMAILCASLTVLSHPEAAWFTVYSGALLFLFFGRSRHGLWTTAVLAAGVLALTAPWWATVLVRYGLAPLLAATQAGAESWFSGLVRLVFYLVDGPYLIASWTVVGLLGLCACLVKREFFLPLWLVAVFLLDPRASAHSAATPLALLAGIGLDVVLLPGLRQLGATFLPRPAEGQPPMEGSRASPGRHVASLAGVVLVLLLLRGLLSAWLQLLWWSPIPVLSQEGRNALQWVVANTAADSRFVVITPDNPYWNPTEEWFPALTGRASLTTVQGYEWLSGSLFARRLEYCPGPQRCATEDAGCLDDWAGQAGERFTHVYISTVSDDPRASSSLCTALESSLRASSDYRLVYDGAGIVVFARAAAGQ